MEEADLIDPRNCCLKKLFEEVFLDRQGYRFKEPTTKDLRKFNLLIDKPEANGDSNYPIGVIIKDWTRSIGVNSVIKAEHDAEEAGLNTVLVVGNQFSLQARGMANRMGIRLISRGELVVGYHQDPAVF